MTTPSTAALEPVPRSPGFALAAAVGLAAPVVASGLWSELALPRLAWAALFVFLAVAHDVHRRRIPSWVPLGAFSTALGWAAWTGGAGGTLEALLGASAAYALLALPRAVGAIGTGDVQAAMALGAGVGAAAVATLSLVALGLGVAFSAARPVPGERAPVAGIPFVIALALALAGQQLLPLLGPA